MRGTQATARRSRQTPPHSRNTTTAVIAAAAVRFLSNRTVCRAPKPNFQLNKGSLDT